VPLTLGGVAPLHVMRAYVAAPNAVDPPADVKDRFGTPSSCDVMQLDALPLTAEGEVDRDALREGEPPGDTSFVPPRTELERRIAELWEELLHVPRVGAGDSFFALGGHSLLAAQLASRLRNAVGIDVPVRTIFESPRLDALAEAVLARRLEAGADGNAAALLQALEEMPEDEAVLLASRQAEQP
jgi:Phosphopantetheine attachment site